MGPRVPFALIVALLLCLRAGAARAAAWSRSYIRALPDSAFASVEVDARGTKHRHLPHHDKTGWVDPAHLRSAFARWKQVRWRDPRNAPDALEHLRRHLKEPEILSSPGSQAEKE